MREDVLRMSCNCRRGIVDTASRGEERPSPFAQQPCQVHTITDRYSMANTYLINDERVVVVDPGSALNVHFALEYLRRFLHRSPADIDLVVLTHLHPDHTAGVEPLRRACSAPIAASAVARQFAQAGSQAHRVIPEVTQFARQILPGAFHHLDLFPPQYQQQTKLIDIWLEDVAGIPYHPDWRVIASPGHTPESLCLYNPFTYELLCGDTVTTLEGGGPLVRGGTNRRQLEDTLRTLRNLEIHYLYPGHGRQIVSKRALMNVQVEW